MSKRIGIFFFLMLLAGGCAIGAHWNELMVLKRFSDNQKQGAQYIETQERGFRFLLKDIGENGLKPGVSRNYITLRYGEGVVSSPVQSDNGITERVLYRDPVKYFSSDKVYLYFDGLHKLVNWEVKR